MDYRIILYIVFGVLPSLAWLFYFLRKDAHPESKKMIVRVFIWGALATLPVFFIQISFSSLLSKMGLPQLLTAILYWFIVIAFVEEIFKFLVARSEVMRSYEFDEPVDSMIYMIISALGFAAMENMLYLFIPDPDFSISFADLVNRTIVVGLVRFMGASFLHALSSALVGYFTAYSYYSAKNKKLIFCSGILLATFLHGLYNFSIIRIGGPLKLIIILSILMFLGIFIATRFEKIKKLKSICLIK